MANYLLSMQFDTNGCTDQRVSSFGGVSFKTPSSTNQLKAAYFEPYNMNAILTIEDKSIKETIENEDWSIYFKYKIKKKDLLEDTPLISYEDEFGNISNSFLTIKDQKYFCIDSTVIYYSEDVEYTFDDNWHTFYIYKEDRVLHFFIDGYPNKKYENIVDLHLGSRIYIGGRDDNGIKKNFIGYLDDFNIFNGIIYYHAFVPPSNYIYQKDVISNYKDSLTVHKEDFEPELVDSIEYNREHSSSHLNDLKSFFLPRFLNLTWKQDQDRYFENYNSTFNMKDSKSIYINITGIDTALLTHDDRYFSSNLETALESNKIWPLLVFINNRFIRLSHIEMVKSDDWYTLIVNKENDISIVESLNIILLPFNVVYEEDYGERADLIPLYIFDKNGKFTPVNGTTYYYIDEVNNTHMKQIGIREHFVTKEQFPFSKAEENPKTDYLRFLWRYGTLELIRKDGEDNAYMQFLSTDREGYVKPGDTVLLYSGTTFIQSEFYKVIGYDLLYIENYSKCGIFLDRMITMQVVTDLKETDHNRLLVDDLTDMKIVEVEATTNQQSTFDIPNVVDRNGNRYSKFLIFKGKLLVEDQDRYTIDYDQGIINFTDKRDFVAVGKSITFVFLKIDKVDARGQLYIKPIFHYCKPNQEELNKFTIPTNPSLVPNKNNCFVFVNGTFISPYRYDIVGSELIIDPESGYLFNKNADIVLVMLKLVSALEDPKSWREKMVQNEIAKGYRFILYDLGIPKEIKITTDNFLCFDDDGLLITKVKGKVYNYNIIKRLTTNEPLEHQVRYLTCLYRDDSLSNFANITKFRNETFLKEYIKGREEFYELDDMFDDLIADFDFTHSSDLSYGENLSKSLDYIISYDQNRIDDVYEKKATAFRKSYDITKFNKSLTKVDDKYCLSIPRDEYDTNRYRTYPLFFKNGLLTDWDVEEDGNNTIVSLPLKLSVDDSIESINFRKMSNTIKPLNSIIQPNKEWLYDIHNSILVGEPYEVHFYADIVVPEIYNKFLLDCSIYVDDLVDAIEVRRDFSKDLFTISITPMVEFVDFIPCTIEVPQEPEGTIIDYQHYAEFGNHYDITCKIEVI